MRSFSKEKRERAGKYGIKHGAARTAIKFDIAVSTAYRWIQDFKGAKKSAKKARR